MKELSKNAFAHCGQLREISIPDGVETLDKETFAECSHPASVKKMTKGVFKDCAAVLMLHVSAGSFAEEYAKKNKIKFGALP